MLIRNKIIKVLYILIIIYLSIFIPSLIGHKPLVIISNSMHPTLKVGGILYYHKIDIEELKIDDVLVYQSGDHIISHRIVDITDEGFITKGDANNTDDYNVVKEAQIIGKGTNWCIPYIGYYADFIYTHKYLLFGGVILLVGDLFIDLYKNHKRRKLNEKS